MFRDRIQAGSILAAKLKKYQDQPGIILAVPRGGVPVAYAVAKTLGLPLDLILTKKIGHPDNGEYAIGAVSLTDYFIISPNAAPGSYITTEVDRIRQRLQKMNDAFRGTQKPPDIAGKIVIVIDDGIATGNTLLATASMLRKSRPAKIVVAVPVASAASVYKLEKVVDEVIAIVIPEEFHAVGAYYLDFGQVSDEEVMYYLDRWRREMKNTA